MCDCTVAHCHLNTHSPRRQSPASLTHFHLFILWWNGSHLFRFAATSVSRTIESLRIRKMQSERGKKSQFYFQRVGASEWCERVWLSHCVAALICMSRACVFTKFIAIAIAF